MVHVGLGLPRQRCQKAHVASLLQIWDVRTGARHLGCPVNRLAVLCGRPSRDRDLVHAITGLDAVDFAMVAHADCGAACYFCLLFQHGIRHGARGGTGVAQS